MVKWDFGLCLVSNGQFGELHRFDSLFSKIVTRTQFIER